jgi:hypothetical protein
VILRKFEVNMKDICYIILQKQKKLEVTALWAHTIEVQEGLTFQLFVLGNIWFLWKGIWVPSSLILTTLPFSQQLIQ